MTSELETNIVAVERLKEYSETKCEANWELESDKKLVNWPTNASIEFKKVNAKKGRTAVSVRLDTMKYQNT